MYLPLDQYSCDFPYPSYFSGGNPSLFIPRQNFPGRGTISCRSLRWNSLFMKRSWPAQQKFRVEDMQCKLNYTFVCMCFLNQNLNHIKSSQKQKINMSIQMYIYIYKIYRYIHTCMCISISLIKCKCMLSKFKTATTIDIGVTFQHPLQEMLATYCWWSHAQESWVQTSVWALESRLACSSTSSNNDWIWCCNIQIKFTNIYIYI